MPSEKSAKPNASESNAIGNDATLKALTSALDRTQNFNFFVIVIAALVAGYAKLDQPWQTVFDLVGMVISGLFVLLDVRGYGLHRRSVDQMSILEPRLWENAGVRAFYTPIPRDGGRRFISHRFIYRAFFVAVGLAWFGALVFKPILK